jgi:hypothetical protein
LLAQENCVKRAWNESHVVCPELAIPDFDRFGFVLCALDSSCDDDCHADVWSRGRNLYRDADGHYIGLDEWLDDLLHDEWEHAYSLVDQVYGRGYAALINWRCK